MTYTDTRPTPSSSMSGAIYTACQIAAKWPNRLPKRQELQEEFKMSKATAYRWLAAMRAARGAEK